MFYLQQPDMDDFLKQSPPDDTGSTTLERFRYQAQVAIPFCIECAMKRDVVSVIMEHFEDIVIEYQDSWHFIQVKTRNADRGPWKVADTWDGIRSLYRSYEKTSDMNARYSLFLEGSVAKKNKIQPLVNSENIPDSLIQSGSKELGIGENECRAFFAVLSVNPEQTSRKEITNHNVSLLSQIAPGITTAELQVHEGRLTDEILKAMSADRLENDLYAYMSNTTSLEEKLLIRVKAKRLDSDAIVTIMGSLVHSKAPLLKRHAVLVSATSKSKLETKLAIAGASQRIVQRAKSLRANTAVREAEILSSGLFGDDGKLEDVQERLLNLAAAVVERYDEEDNPAKVIWKELLKELGAEKDLVDPNRLYFQDAFLLLGAVCELSDQCLIDWGVPLA